MGRSGRDEVIAQVRDAWLEVALSDGDPDPDGAERALIRAFRAVGFRAPRVTWAPSPWAGAIEQARAKHRGDGEVERRGDRRFGTLATSVAPARDATAEPAWALVHRQAFGARHADRAGLDAASAAALDRMRTALAADVHTWVMDPVTEALQESLDAADTPEPLRAELSLWHLAHLPGQWEAAELAWAEAADRLGGRAPSEVAVALADLARAGVGLWWCRRATVVLTPRPLRATRDAQGRLHSEGARPALVWSDGWGVHAWHGVRVPADLAAGRWDLARISAEPDPRLRRCAAERMGWPRFIASAGLSAVGVPAPDPGRDDAELVLYDLPAGLIADEPARLLLCEGGAVGVTVPAGFDNPVAAAAWSYGLDAETYAGADRRC